MPKDYSQFPIHTHSANELADIQGSKFELNRALSFCNELAKFDPLGKEILEKEALSISLAIKYVRAHKIPKNGIKEDVLKLNKSQNKLHEELLQYRNKHIAHSASELDQFYTTAQIGFENGKEPVFSAIGFHGQSHIPALAGDGLQVVINLIKYEISQLEKEIDLRKQTIYEEFKNVDIEDIIAKGNAMGVKRNPNINKGRSRKSIVYKKKA